MLITLPFVLLLLDFWPLKRWNFDPQKGKNKSEELAALVFEKIPLFILTTIASFATYLIQRGDGAVKSLELFSLQARFNNAMVSYMEYLGKTLWPTKLSIYYPHPGNEISLWQVAICAIILLAMTVFVVRMIRRAPYLFVGTCEWIKMHKVALISSCSRFPALKTVEYTSEVSAPLGIRITRLCLKKL